MPSRNFDRTITAEETAHAERLGVTAIVEASRAAQARRLGVSLDDLDEALREQDRIVERQEKAKAFARARAEVVHRFGHRMRPELVRPFLADELRDETALVEGRAHALDPKKQILILSGGTGAGKTAAAFYALALTGFPLGDFTRALDLVSRIQPRSKAEEAQKMDLRHRLVILDDLGGEDVDERRFLPCLEEFFDGRQGQRNGAPLLTIVTCNMTAQVIKERYGERIASRLKGITRFVEIANRDMRGEP